jgi:hypothetical protein
VISFDYNALAVYYASGASLSPSLQTAVIRNGTLSDAIALAESGVLPPWDQPEPEVDSDDAGRFLRGGDIIDLDDPRVDQPDASDDFKNLFGLYIALSTMRDMAEFTRDNDSLQIVLDRQFQTYLAEVRGFADDTGFDGIILVSGLRNDLARSTVEMPAINPIADAYGTRLAQSFTGSVITDSRTTAIAGINGTDTFTIDVTTSTGTKNVTIDLSQVSGTLSIDNIVTEINAQLAAAGGISSTVFVEEVYEGGFAIEVKHATGETLTFGSPTSTEASVYVAGNYGAGATAGGFVAKIDDLGAADPNQAFRQSINTVEASDRAGGVAVDSEGNVYVVGTTAGDLDGQGVTGTEDAYLTKYDASGNLLYTLRLGATESAGGFAVAVDSADNVIIAGHTLSPLTDTAYGGGFDTFVTKFDSTGKELFTRQAAPYAADSGLAITVDSSDNIFISGVTSGAIDSSQTNAGGNDAFVTKIDSSGTLVYNKQFGGAGDDSANAVAVDNAGNVFVAATVDGDAVVRKYADDDADDPPIWELNLGALGSDGDATGIALDANGDVYVTGYTTNASLAGTIAQAHSGGTDAFVTRIVDSGTSAAVDFTSYIGASGTDRALGIAVNNGAIYVTGETDGSIGGETLSGQVDAFVAKLDNMGSLTYAHYIGGGFDHRGTAIAFDADGTSVLSRLGLPTGTVPIPTAATVAMQTSARVGQSFYVSVNGAAAKRITIEDSDTIEVLAAKISNRLGVDGDAKIVTTGHTQHLEIQALNGAVIEILEGPEGFNALPGLGLTPQRLIGELVDASKQEADADSTFELGFTSTMNLSTSIAADDALTLLENAMREVREAFSFLTDGPPPDDPFAGIIGPPSPYMAGRIAAFEGALSRIESANLSSLFGILV